MAVHYYTSRLYDILAIDVVYNAACSIMDSHVVRLCFAQCCWKVTCRRAHIPEVGLVDWGEAENEEHPSPKRASPRVLNPLRLFARGSPGFKSNRREIAYLENTEDSWDWLSNQTDVREAQSRTKRRPIVKTGKFKKCSAGATSTPTSKP